MEFFITSFRDPDFMVRTTDFSLFQQAETDKKRERRKKKSAQRSRAAEKEKREKLVNKLNPGLGNKYSKAKMMKDLESAEKQVRNIMLN